MIEYENRKVLDNIHNILTWSHGQNYTFNACMAYLMECMNEDEEYNYCFFSGVTGDSFTQVFRTDYTEFTCCLSQDMFSYDIAKKTFDACGYDFIYVDDIELKANQLKYIDKIKLHINSGKPIITKGHKHNGEFCIICGYDMDNNSLLILEGEEDTPKEVQDLTQHSDGLVFIGTKLKSPPIDEVYREVVMSIPYYLSKPPENGLSFGKQAFLDWANSFMDGRFDNVPTEELDAWKIHGTYLCMAGTNGASRGFVSKTLQLNPDMEFLNNIKPILEKKQKVFKDLTQMEGGFNIAPEKFKNKDIMRPISDKILESAEYCNEIIRNYNVFVRSKAMGSDLNNSLILVL